MITLARWIVCLFLFLSSARSANTIPLFDGKTLQGWIVRGGKASYEVVDGEIVGTSVAGTPNSFLCTERDYADFTLDLDFNVDPRLNSGVQIRSECFAENKTLNLQGKEIKIPAERVHGYQVEIDVDPQRKRWWTGGLYDEARRGWLFPGPMSGDGKAFTEQGARLTSKEGWHHLRIEALGSSLKTWLDGEPRASMQDSLTPRGLIGLQVHGVGSDAAKVGLKARFKNLVLQLLEGAVDVH